MSTAKVFLVASGGTKPLRTRTTWLPARPAAVTDTMGRMHSDAQLLDLPPCLHTWDDGPDRHGQQPDGRRHGGCGCGHRDGEQVRSSFIRGVSVRMGSFYMLWIVYVSFSCRMPRKQQGMFMKRNRSIPYQSIHQSACRVQFTALLVINACIYGLNMQICSLHPVFMNMPRKQMPCGKKQESMLKYNALIA